MLNSLVPGVSHNLSLQVNDQLLVTAFTPHFPGFADLPPVFATAFLVGFMEWACIETLKPYLLDGENTVGTHVYLSHVAPTPAGMTVTAEVNLGSRTVMEYLLSPVQKVAHEAGREM